MALPLVTLPRGLPAWLSAGHGIEPQPLYANTAMSTGPAIRRRVYRSAPRVATVGLFLTAEQMRAFWYWFEGPLIQAGAGAFSAQLPDQGPRGLLWWHARFVEPPTYEAQPRGRWRLTAKLLLTGQGSTVGPPVPDLASTATLAVRGSAALRVSKPLASEALMAWVPRSGLASEASMAWLGAAATRTALASQSSMAWLAAGAVDVPASYVKREDGGYALREDGGRIMREA